MEEKKQIKISLGTAICIFIIVLLLIALVLMYIYFNKDDIVKVGNEPGIQQEEKTLEDADKLNCEKAYKDFYHDFRNSSTEKEIIEYALTDIDADGTAELMIKKGTCEADMEMFFFTYKNGKVVELGTLYCGNTGFYEMNDGNYLLAVEGHMGSERTYKISINNNKIETYDEEHRYIDLDEDYKEGDQIILFSVGNELEILQYNDETESISKISKEDAYFVIEDIVEKGDKYEITANMLEKEARRFSEDEYNRILDGEKFAFRGTEWKLKELQVDEGYENSAMLVTSGNDSLWISYYTEEKAFCLENYAGVKSGGLADYSDDIIKFEVDKDIYVGSFWTSFSNDNGKIKIESANGGENNNLETCTMKDLIDWNFGNEYSYSGSYEECKATVIDGKVVAIQMFVK